MRAASFALAVLIGLLFAVPCARAQEWISIRTTKDGFRSSSVPSRKSAYTVWTTQQGYVLPARGTAPTATRQLSIDDGRRLQRHPSGSAWSGRRSVRLAPRRVRASRPAACVSVIGPGYATQDIRDAIVYATFEVLQKDVKVSEYLWNWRDLVEGHQLQLTNTADQSRTHCHPLMHENKLYIQDATVPKGYPEPGLFQRVTRVRGQGRQAAFATRLFIRTSFTGCASTRCHRSCGRLFPLRLRPPRQPAADNRHKRKSINELTSAC
mgnify:CR=1 FL=1